MQISGRDIAYLSVARYFAKKSQAKNTHGAVVVKGGRVLGTGFNKNRNNPHYVSPEHIKTDCSTHAEESAIRDAGCDVKGAIIYVARINKVGEDRDSKPCPRCLTLIKESGIKRIIHTTNSGRIDVS
jgi:pyrimidine deaminase RibD-like protein